MKHWRAAHTTLGATTLVGWASGYIPGGVVHVWLATLALPAVAWLVWVGGRFLLSLRRKKPRRQVNAVLARLSLTLVVLTAITGVLTGIADGTLEQSRALRWHTVSADLLLPTLAAHVGLALSEKLARRHASRARENG